MAKDPAFLFYTSDFLTGTMLFTDEQVGKYIRILCKQHQSGHLSEKDMLKICKTHDEDIFEKFLKDDDGLYYNERLEIEHKKRQNYSKSRSENRSNKGTKVKPVKKKKTSKSYVQHMENENEDVIVSKIPTLIQVCEYFKEKGYTEMSAKKAFDYYDANNWHDKNGDPVLSWKQKMIANWMKPENKEQTKPPLYQPTERDKY